MGTETIRNFARKALILGLFWAASCNLALAELIEINRVVAKVNDRVVTWGEIEGPMDRLNFSEEEKKSRASEFVDGKIDRLLSIAAFKEKGMIIPETFIEQRYNERLIREFNGDRKLFRDVLRSKGQSQLEFRKDLEEEIIYNHMLSSRKRLKEEISPEKVEEYYENNPNLFKTESRVRLREIVFSQIAGEPQSVLLQQAEKVLGEIEKGLSFEKLASSNGQSPFREQAGDWGFLVSSREIRNERIREKAFALKEGEISKPFVIEVLERNEAGEIQKSGKVAVYVIQVTKKVSSGRKPLDEVRQEIEQALASQYESQSQRQWFGRLKKNAYVRVSLPE